MYQGLLIFALVVCFGAAGYITFSQGSVQKVYKMAESDPYNEDKASGEIITLPDITDREPGLGEKIRAAVFGTGETSPINPILAKTVVGTYACLQAGTTTNCENDYTFTFKKNSAAVLKVTGADGTVATTEVGTWGFNNDGQIVVNLYATSNSKPLPEARIFTLDRATEWSGLVAVDYPKTYYPDIITGAFKFIKK